jgi:HTH-type transcriptional regulator/antitoxin HipB
MAGPDLAGMLRRIRRQADLSQREMAARCGVAPSVIAHAEAGRRGLPVQVLVSAAALAGLRLALVDEDGREIAGMAGDAVRDKGNRRFPAHLDTRYSDEDWWHGPHRYDRDQPWYTFDRDRRTRDTWRRSRGTPEDHQRPRPGDSPADRVAAHRLEFLRHTAAERERAFLAGELSRLPQIFTCTCPPDCDTTDAVTGALVHAEGCPCSCDLG